MESQTNDEFELTIWKNGKHADSCFKIQVSKDVNTIQKLKGLILF